MVGQVKSVAERLLTGRVYKVPMSRQITGEDGERKEGGSCQMSLRYHHEATSRDSRCFAADSQEDDEQQHTENLTSL